jgi:hypothetical protein
VAGSEEYYSKINFQATGIGRLNLFKGALKNVIIKKGE